MWKEAMIMLFGLKEEDQGKVVMENVIKTIYLSLMRNDPAKLRRGERGQSLVELALSLTVILLLLAGAVDFSIAYFSFSAMQDAAQEGALYGSINPEDEEV